MTDEVWNERTERLAAARKRVAATYPTRCPACESVVIAPTFLEPSEWECCNVQCRAIWRQP